MVGGTVGKNYMVSHRYAKRSKESYRALLVVQLVPLQMIALRCMLKRYCLKVHCISMKN